MSSTNKIEEEILKRMERHFLNADKAREWYYKPNIYFMSGYNDDPTTPALMVLEGRGDEVLAWIKMCIGI